MKNTIKAIVISSLFISGVELISKTQRPSEAPRVERPEVEKARFPKHWGHPPQIQLRDRVKLPGRFGFGSSTLAKWISENIKRDAEKKSENDNIKPTPNPKPKPPVKPVPPIAPITPPSDIKEKMKTYESTKRSLESGLRLKIKELGDKPTREQVRKVVDKYKFDNKDLIDSQKEIGKSIHDWRKESAPQRPDRPEPAPEIKEKIEEVKKTEKALVGVREAFHEALRRSKDMTKEDRDSLIKEFKETNAEKHKALKEAQKELQQKIRQIQQDGARRK